MASKKTAKKPARPTTPVARIGAALAHGASAEAYRIAAEEFRRDRIANAELLFSIFQRSTEQALDNSNWVQALGVALGAYAVDRYDPAWRKLVAVRLAQSGESEKALEVASGLNDPALPTSLLGHAADFALRTNNANAFPELHRPAFEAIRTAFGHYRAKADEAAREALNSVGLQSPFLEWKVLLRGLIAWTGNDSSKALENFGRLKAERIPAKLAAPFRFKIDSAFADSQSEEQRRVLGLAYLAFDRTGLSAKLRTLLPLFSICKNLQPLFKALEPVVTSLRREGPALVPRLANAVYFTIQRGGQPDDMNRFTKVFGPPRSDPEFSRLQGIVLEEMEEFENSLKSWANYESWLATGAAHWPEPMTKRARAIVLNRMGGLAEDSEEDPRRYYRRAVALAPEYPEPNRNLFGAEIIAMDAAAAEKVGRAYAILAPNDLELLTGLAMLLAKRGKHADAFEFQKRALAINPLDAAQRTRFATRLMAYARTEAVAGKLKRALAILTESGTVPVETEPVLFFALRSAICRKIGDGEAADEEESVSLKSVERRLEALFARAVNGAILKWKPKEKAEANKEFVAELALEPGPRKLIRVAFAFENFEEEGVDFPWFNAQSKKIYGEMTKCDARPGEETDFEILAQFLRMKSTTPAVQSWLKRLAKRFPKNPVFPYALGKLLFDKQEGEPILDYKIRKLLETAQKFSQGSTEISRKAIYDDATEILKASDPFANFFDLFGRR